MLISYRILHLIWKVTSEKPFITIQISAQLAGAVEYTVWIFSGE